MAQGRTVREERTYAMPTRGQQAPDLVGLTPQGAPMSLRRAYYMRRNLGILFVNDDETGRRWLRDAADQRDAAHAEVGEIVTIVPHGMDTNGLPALVDADGSLSLRYGLSQADLPAVFVTDRYFVIFSTNTGDSATPGLLPADIPGWLEFIAARCS